MDADTAWKVFLCGIFDTAHGRANFTRRRAGPLLAVRFTKPRAGTVVTFDEYLGNGVTPEQVRAALANDAHLAAHYVTVLCDDGGVWNADALPGYRVSVSERLMARPLSALPAPDPAVRVRLVGTENEAAWLNAHDPDNTAWIAPLNLADPAVTHAYILSDGFPAARGGSVRCGDALYITSIHTSAAYRRRGLARALMLRLLAEGAERRATWSVLTSSAAGEALYAGLGYATLGTLLVFEPANTPPGDTSGKARIRVKIGNTRFRVVYAASVVLSADGRRSVSSIVAHASSKCGAGSSVST